MRDDTGRSASSAVEKLGALPAQQLLSGIAADGYGGEVQIYDSHFLVGDENTVGNGVEGGLQIFAVLVHHQLTKNIIQKNRSEKDP